MIYLLYQGIRLQLGASLVNMIGILKTMLGSGLFPFIYLHFWQIFIECLLCSRYNAGSSKISKYSFCVVKGKQNNIERRKTTITYSLLLESSLYNLYHIS